jgi:mono/diheme cytochrome c family protein
MRIQPNHPRGCLRGARLAGLAAVGVVLLGCGGGDDAPTVPPLPAEEIAAAKAVFEAESCSMCHGDDARGSDLAPALADLGGFWDEDRLVRYLENPAAFIESNPAFDQRRDTVYEIEMPAYDHVPEDDRRLLARWLLTR